MVYKGSVHFKGTGELGVCPEGNNYIRTNSPMIKLFSFPILLFSHSLINPVINPLFSHSQFSQELSVGMLHVISY